MAKSRLHIQDLMTSASPSVSVKLGPCLGDGAFRSRAPLWALRRGKKNRASPFDAAAPSSSTNARILCLLQGHPAIPEVYAVGRFEHFEYMSMELLGSPIGEGPMLSTAHLTAQMISALQHVHGHDIIHRDIKPSNMLRCPRDPLQIWLIDFGLAHPLPKNTDTAALTEDLVVVGTLHYASLNAHRGIALTRRDDLESLAYVLFSEIRNEDLPWKRKYGASVTPGFVRRQVRECKRAWSGTRLADGYEPLFGVFLDEARQLTSDATLDYCAWEHNFSQLARSPPPNAGVLPESNMTLLVESSHDSPVQPGQLVYARLPPKSSIEGYTISQAHPSAWQDPTLSDAAWPTTFLPAVVLDLWDVQLAALTRREPDAEVMGIRVHSGAGDAASGGQVRVAGEGWPAGDVWCVTYVRNTFVWSPDQDAPIPAHWSLGEDSLDALRAKVGAPDTTCSPLPDNKMLLVKGQVAYIEGQPLNPDTLCGLTCGEVNWASERAWFDELVPIAERQAHDDGWLWTVRDGSQKELSDSYSEEDITAWRNVQQEREEFATLGAESEAMLDAQLGRITAVE
ncbi:hypothetical protein B0H10DRAFT_2210131 [Mycena sp. CBHHK59/15]|nr:hypothetical protein B0H10DRAFT_2210131 [Mycena sp. CBHHK59/15]